MSSLEIINSWADVYLVILVTFVEVTIFVMVYSVYKVLGVLRYHPGFSLMMAEAKERKTGVVQSTSNYNDGEYLDNILGDEEDG